MSKAQLGVIAALVFVMVALGVYFCMSIGYKNREVALRNLVKAKQEDNKNVFDNTWKQISQVAEVTDAQRDALKDIIVGYAKARDGGGGSLAKAIHEAVPNVDTSTFNNLQNIIVAARNKFERTQTELLDYNREHDVLLESPVSGWFLSGCQHIDVTIVTSSRTQNAYFTGKDDDVSVFKRSKPEAPKAEANR
jgi:hypothetical protein